MDSTGLLNPTTGSFKQGAAAAASGSNPNPYVDHGPWGRITIGGLRIPGIVLSIDGAKKPAEWTTQKATARSNGTTIFKGIKNAETITIVTALHDLESFAAYYEVRDALRPPSVKPPSHMIENAAINFSRITRVSTIDVEPPTWVKQGGYWSGTVVLVEFNPEKPANTGPASYFQAKSDPNGDVKAELQKTLDAASKL